MSPTIITQSHRYHLCHCHHYNSRDVIVQPTFKRVISRFTYGFQRAPATYNKIESHLTVNATKSPMDDTLIANVKQEKCQTRFKVGHVDKESEARGEASRTFFRQLLSAQLCRLISSLAGCRNAPFGIQALTPTQYDTPNVTRRRRRGCARILTK